MHNRIFIILLQLSFSILTVLQGQTFSVENVIEISIPDRVIERPQFSRDDNWLCIETYSAANMEVYFVDLRNGRRGIPLKKTPKSSRSMNARQVRWSTTRDDLCYLIGKDQIGMSHFYEVDMSNLKSNRKFLDDLCEKIFGRHNVDISTYAVNKDTDIKDYILFAYLDEKKEESRIGIYTSFLDEYPQSYKGVLLDHFSINAASQLTCIKGSDISKNPKIVLFEEDVDQTTEVVPNWSVTMVAEIEPKFSIYSVGDYLTFLATEEPELRDWYLWSIRNPFNSDSKPRKIAGPLVVRGEDISLNDLNYAWHPNHDVVFYIMESKDGSNPVYYHNMNSDRKQKLVTNTERNMYVNISPSGKKIVFGSQGKSEKLDFYTRKAYVGDLVVK